MKYRKNSIYFLLIIFVFTLAFKTLRFAEAEKKSSDFDQISISKVDDGGGHPSPISSVDNAMLYQTSSK